MTATSTSATSSRSQTQGLAGRPERYDGIARLLHWAMALGFVVVFAAAVGHFLAEDSAFDKAVWPIHKPVGALLFVLALLRAIWGLANAGRRPASVNRAAHLGHLTLYVLMLAIPAIGLLRQYGSGRAFEPFGLMVFEARPDKVQWMTDLGGLLHGELGWLFLACIVGHVGLALWHRRKGPDVLPRMIG